MALRDAGPPIATELAGAHGNGSTFGKQRNDGFGRRVNGLVAPGTRHSGEPHSTISRAQSNVPKAATKAANAHQGQTRMYVNIYSNQGRLEFRLDVA